jgi:hypothetical protein
MKNSFKYYLPIILSLLFNSNANVLFGQSDCIDTTLALVEYGSDFLLDNGFYNERNPHLKIDSIISIQKDDKQELVFLKKYFKSSSIERILIRDSLFTIQPVPYKLVNELERMIFYLKDEVAEISKIRVDLTGDSQFPSNEIYQVWSTKQIWNHVKIDLDSSFVFSLNDGINKYTHPICVTTIKKYGGVVTSKQGWRDGKRHNGVDINCDQWDSVKCAFNGKVRFAKEYEGYGKVVVVRHYNGLETVYAHLAKIKVKAGQNINSGELVGLAGSTGSSEGSHLHFEIRFKDQVLNPQNIIDFEKFELKSDSLLLRKAGNAMVAIPLNYGFHTIERGDYPLKIATRYGMNISTFTEINNITNQAKLKVGERVIIK